MSLKQSINHLQTSKQNKLKIISQLQKYTKEEQQDIIYEMAFEMSFKDQEKNETIKSLYKALKNGEMGLYHQDFTEISKKIEETDTFMNKPFDVSEGVNQCSKCKSYRTISFTKQIRGGDEGAHVFVTCIDCKFRYSMNS